MTDVDQKDKPTNYSETTDSVYKTTSKPQFRSRSAFKRWQEYLGLTRNRSKSEKYESIRYQSINNALKCLRHDRRSDSYCDMMCQEVYRFCIFTKKNPEELVQLLKKEIEQIIQSYIDCYQNSPNYARTKGYVLIAFFKANGFENEKELKIDLPPRMISKPKNRPYIPTLEEANKMAECATSLRDKAIIYLLISTGLRTSTLIAIRFGIGSDDPNLEQYTIKNELLNNRRNLMIVVSPKMKKFNSNACKGNIEYYTFTSVKAKEALVDFIILRIAKYRSIPDEAPLFETEYNQIKSYKRNVTPISSREMCNIVHKCAKMAGIKKWKSVTPMSLRKLYREILRNHPEAQPDYEEKEFFMGHLLKRPQLDYFNQFRCEELRAKYARLDFTHSPVFTENKQQRSNDASDTENLPSSTYSELTSKLEKMQNAWQLTFPRNLESETHKPDLASEKPGCERTSSQQQTDSPKPRNHKNLDDFFKDAR